MKAALAVGLLGLISLLVGTTSTEERAWTWPFSWIGIALLVAAIVLAVRAWSATRSSRMRT